MSRFFSWLAIGVAAAFLIVATEAFEQNKQSVGRLVAVLSALDVGGVKALLADDARWVIVRGPPTSGDHHQNDVFAAVTGTLGARFAGPPDV